MKRVLQPPPVWILKGEEFYIASRFLYFQHFFDSSMVCGHFALELILKTILLQAKNIWEQGQKGHDLSRLYKMLVETEVVVNDKIIAGTTAHYKTYYKDFKYPEFLQHESKSGINMNTINNLDYTVAILRKSVDYNNPKWTGNYSPIKQLLSSTRNFEDTKKKALITRNNYIKEEYKYQKYKFFLNVKKKLI